jgi:type I restriction enzyme S subunit
MKLSYKRIGDYIHRVEERNNDLKVGKLLGLSMTKEFREPTSNIIGTDMSVYKVVRKWQFACDFMSVIRVHKFPVALKTDDEPILVSPAYPVFEVNNVNELHPEYLMMWFRRSEFDRYADFKCDSAIRGGYDWTELCNTEIPVPHINKQKEIVKEYNVLQNRIALNNQLIQKLEETAQAIYKQWFVDFEFPDEQGKPYKSNGGEMEFDEKLEREIPKSWKVGQLNDVIDLVISHRGKSKSIMELYEEDDRYTYPVISAMNINDGRIVKHNTIKYADDVTFNAWMKDPLAISDVIMTSEAPMGELFFVAKKTNFILSQRLFAIRVDKKKSRGVFLFFWLQTLTAKNDLDSRSTGTTVSGIKLSELKKVVMLLPSLEIIVDFEKKVESIMKLLDDKKNEIKIICRLKNLLLSKLSTIGD